MNIHDLDTPALVVDLDVLEDNIARMAHLIRSNGKRLRPHTKTHKTPEIARLQLAAGAVGLTVAKLGEAEVMAAAGLHDLLVANEVVGAAKLARLVKLARGTRVTVGVDSLEVALPVAEAGRRAGVTLGVSLEIDTGLHRAGVREVEQALALGVRLADTPGIELRGIFTHEGHVYGAEEAERARRCADAAEKMRAIAEGLRRAGVGLEDVSVGSTPGAAFMATEPGITEMRPGVYAFGDAMQVALGASAGSCALTVLTTVISRPEETVAIVDAGTKALSGDRAAAGSRHGFLLEDAGVAFDWASEEHGHLDLTPGSLRPAIGDKLRVVPYHACACVNMHAGLYGARGRKVEAAWQIAARGRMR